MDDEFELKPIGQKMVEKLWRSLKELQKNWKSIGCTRETREMYYNQAYNHMEDLFNEMITESQTKQQLLLDSIKDLLKQRAALYTELHLEMESENYDQTPLCKVEQMLQSEMQELEHMKKERMMIFQDLLAKEYDICKKLGAKKINIIPDVLPTEQELESFKLYLQKQENEKIRLESVFTDLRRSLFKMMDDLDIVPSSPLQQLICENPEEFVLSANNMTKLKEFRDELKTQVEETKCHVEKMKKDLLALWKYLDEPADVCQLFLDRYSDYSTGTINALSAEIKRCKEKRKEDIFMYVTQIRLELMNLWDLCKYCETERNTFAPFHSNTFTEDLLTLHELEVKRLRKFYNDNLTIFELLEERENLIIKIKELLQRANNPDRYHNRGGQLLMEEKERKVIRKKLPKIEAELQRLVNEYETKHNQMFTIYGTPLENVLAETWESINYEKETLKKARKEAKDKSIKKSPLNSSKKTPGISHLSIHRGPTPLSKRKLFNPSPNNTSLKRRNKNSDKNKPTVSASKIRRSGRIPKIVQKAHRFSNGRQKKKQSLSPANSTTETTYNQFQDHMSDREELHSSMLPEHILKNSSKANINKTPIIRTPMKPLRKNLSAATTPVTRGSARKSPHSPKFNSTPKLVTAPNNLPFIF
ncbi:protein regulator of cytokinesis 1-like [Anoplolepis gracilipes]|uniref:protein regulator of cytokinesis 1-like n=1 Tax=Anoplolepis gracilipes TaxID=354296 RepID=UPI003B9E9D09